MMEPPPAIRRTQTKLCLRGTQLKGARDYLLIGVTRAPPPPKDLCRSGGSLICKARAGRRKAISSEYHSPGLFNNCWGARSDLGLGPLSRGGHTDAFTLMFVAWFLRVKKYMVRCFSWTKSMAAWSNRGLKSRV